MKKGFLLRDIWSQKWWVITISPKPKQSKSKQGRCEREEKRGKIRYLSIREDWSFMSTLTGPCACIEAARWTYWQDGTCKLLWKVRASRLPYAPAVHRSPHTSCPVTEFSEPMWISWLLVISSRQHTPLPLPQHHRPPLSSRPRTLSRN